MAASRLFPRIRYFGLAALAEMLTHSARSGHTNFYRDRPCTYRHVVLEYEDNVSSCGVSSWERRSRWLPRQS